MGCEEEVYYIVLNKNDIGKEKIEKVVSNLIKLLIANDSKIPDNLKRFFPENPDVERHILITNGDGNVKCEIKNKAYLKGAYHATPISSEKYFHLEKDLPSYEKP